MAWSKQSSRGKKVSCFNCNQEGHLVKDCPKNRGGAVPEKKKLVCFFCNQEGHFKQDCPNKSQNAPPASEKRLCFLCNQPGHLKQDCPSKNPRPAQDWSDKVCYNCNQPGHFVKDCPVKDEGAGERERERQLCFLCNQPGHLKQDCPSRKDGQESKVQCYHCNQLGHFKRDCPDMSEEYKSSTGRESGPRSRGYEESGAAAEEHWPILSKDPEVKGKFSQPISSPGPPPGLTAVAVQTADKNKPTRNTNGTEKNEGFQSSAAVETESNRTDRNRGRDRREFREPRTPFPPFIDTHCHLEYVFERYNHTSTFSEFMKEWKYPSNFDGCIASFCDPAAFSSFGTWSDLLAEPDSKVWAAFGVHPHNAKYYHSTQELEEKLLKCLEHSRCVALGEIGLDYGERSPSDHTTQKEVFVHQLKLGVTLEKPFVLHCRDAEDDMLEILKEHVPKEWKIHFHCFTGQLATALEYLSTFPNSYLGVCGNVTYDNARKVIAVAQEVPLDRLLVETDAPYNTPRNLPRAGRCKHSHPAHAHYVAKEIARLKGIDLVEVLSTVRKNTKAMYGI